MWNPVSKGSPCPLCSKADWCNIASDGLAVQCGRIDKASPPPGWRFSKTGSDGRPIFHKISENPSPDSDKALRNYLSRQGKKIPPGTRIQRTIHHYSSTQQIHRFDWPDPSREKGRDKAFIQKHFDPKKGEWICGKGDTPWPAYNESAALQWAKNHFLLFLEGERCVDLAISAGIQAATFSGSNWDEGSIRDLIQKAQKAGIEKVVYWGDGDPPGKEKAKKIQKVCGELLVPLVRITNRDLIPDAGEKDDIEEAFDSLGKEAVVSFLQEKVLQTTEVLPEEKLLFSIEELSQSIGEKEPLLEDLFDQGDTVLIAGKPGAGKSVFATILMSAVENGIPFMGKNTTQSKTAIVNVDQSLRVTIGYVEKYCRWPKKPLLFDSKNLGGMFDLRDSNHRKLLIADLVKQGVGVVCLDSWRAAIGDSDENASSSVYPLIQLKKELEPHGISLILVHHANKIGESRGSNALEGAVDVCLLLKADPTNPKTRILKCYKNRLNEIGEWNLTLNLATGNHEAVQANLFDPPKLKPEQEILRWIRQSAPDRPVTAKEIQDELGMAKTIAYDALKSLTAQGGLLKTGNAWQLPLEEGDSAFPHPYPHGNPENGKIPDLVRLSPSWHGVASHEYDV